MRQATLIQAPVQRRERSREISTAWLAAWLNFPTSALVIVVIGYSLLYSLYLVFHSAGPADLRSGRLPFVGAGNVYALFADPVFWASLRTSTLFTVISVPLITGFGLFVALAMSYDQLRIARVTRVVVLLPWAVPPIANGLMWSFTYNPTYGYLTGILNQLHLGSHFAGVLSSPMSALLAVVVAYVWRSVPLAAILLYAGLRGIDAEIYEAADLDGAGWWQRTWSIIVPILRPVLLVVLLLRTVWSFQIFDEIFAITQGGPGNSTWSAVYYIFAQGFHYFAFGVASAASYTLLLIIGLAAILYIRFLYREAA